MTKSNAWRACMLTALTALVPWTAMSANAADAADSSVKEPEAARVATEILDRLDAAWNLADGKAFAAEFSANADVINVFGAHFKGRPAVAERMQLIFDTIFKGSRHRSRAVEIARQVAGDLILVVSSARISVPSGPQAPELHSRQTFLLKKEGSEWRIMHWHNTPVRKVR